IVDRRTGGGSGPHPGGGCANGPVSNGRVRVIGSRLQEQEQTRDRLCVLELAQALRDLFDPPADDLYLLVLLRTCRPSLHTFRDEQVHPLSAEARRRVERCELAPASAVQADLLRQLAARALERRLARLERAGRQLEQPLARRLAQLSHE